MIKKRQNKKTLICPHCGQSFQRPQALGGHIRYKHADTLGSKPAQPKKRKKKAKAPAVTLEPIIETKPVVESILEEPDVVVSVAESLEVPALVATTESVSANTGAHEHLKRALAELMEHQRQIDEDLARMQALQAEKEAVGKQINAVNSALQAFDAVNSALQAFGE